MEPEKILEKVKGRVPEVLGNRDFSKYAILLPLIEKEDGVHILFEVRSFEMRRQPGEICFPGGRIDHGDEDEEETALRETMEELGIRKEAISNVFPLDYIVSPFGMIVYSFAGFIDPDTDFKPNPPEVDSVFTVPLKFFLENEPRVYRIDFDIQPEESFPYDLIAGGENYSWRARQVDEFFYLYEDRVIWGLTAKILMHFMELIR
ncbi:MULTISPECIES: CoA pyrophosphatase [unclassified Planococcus (in: firmicutes)]|uniref:NUDIX hydrolase n=1 Tax=unclassified Planococcus (in: firmicutes) TaxID=2662419 RepID=UPI000C347D5B|nr:MULTISPECIES: CoA pyrophosphatase [unclassified Planococcus (in: firmicutes)]AUD15166.1 coenzyme A pyrophosphatase [Planococcus sp. MB-3u-03]PKG46298.1 coenzyme A pyrophosphatase [Planococcus sp. Urea-trap-24]PKG90084.1 coenzyme A pyrophosphatase [Planococcus sp. Urea-3u-39]PKH35796.1 coenzyme A pyrophosphatase [Planococcus sp. MB-3u-09]